MSRGRKSFSSSITDNWERAFFNSIGHYIMLINKGLRKSFKSEPLSSHIKIVGGFAFKNAEYKSAGIPIIRISDFNNEKIILDSVVYYQESRLLEKYELKESDIIIALTGGTIGKLGIVQAGLGKLYLNQRVGKFDILNPEEFEKEYIYWIARGVEGIVKNLAWGAAIPNVSPKQIEELDFPIPTKNIQKNIISFLNDLRNDTVNDNEYFDLEIEEAIKDIQKRQVKSLEIKGELSYQLTQIENLNQAILREAVQGKLVEQKISEGLAKELIRLIKSEKLKNGEKCKLMLPIEKEKLPFSIPKNWEWCRLGEIVKMGRGRFSIRPRNDQSCFGGIYPFIQIGSLDSIGSSINEYQQTLNDKGLKASKIFPKETIVIAIVGGTIGNLGILGLEMCFPDSIIGIEPMKFYNQKYILYFLRYAQPEIKKAAYQMSGQPNIKMPTLENLILPLPPLSEQNRIVTEIEKQFAKTKQLKEHIIANQQATDQLLKALLHQAFEVEEMEVI